MSSLGCVRTIRTPPRRALVSWVGRCSVTADLENEDSFQLLPMTSLYLATKIHSTRKISACCMSLLTKGCFTVDQILSMEICIMQTLRWHLNPPTPSIYLNVIEPLIEASF
mmetsp:Transcript_58622/g.124416  ORF Transcript_58622/g.124416 Transcript_58622/m.124416 type:complete len:111 (+) Transcript_58622:496-828(+)